MLQTHNFRKILLSFAVMALLSAVFVTPARANNVSQFLSTFSNSTGNSIGSAAGNSIGNSMLGNPSSSSGGAVMGNAYDDTAKNKPSNYRSNYVAPDAPSADSVYGDNSNCRQYPQNFTVNGRTQQYLRTACMQPDGTWKVVQ